MSENMVEYKGFEIFSFEDPFFFPGNMTRFDARKVMDNGSTKFLGVSMNDAEAVKPWIDEYTASESKAPVQENTYTVKMVKCSCGHTVPASLVMSANLGTSCQDCYDRMSD